MASNSSCDGGKGKEILELQQKASELSTLLGSDTEKQSKASTSNQSSSVSFSYMPSFRKQLHPSSNTFHGKGKGKSVVKGSFMRDVILLPGPNLNRVPRQTKCGWVMENRFMISGFQLQKEQSVYRVEASLEGAFDEKMDFEILMLIHLTLVKPSLAPEQDLNGVMLNRVFTEKPIYLRPFKEICDSSICSVERFNQRYWLAVVSRMKVTEGNMDNTG
ncbi:hypothetical protein AWC38_SpisGene13454 [Stylophora pistillata]|uniref:Uncharacterized protein n=1 Tax=Stylophora pistillata TaxID=50429 RepID=A0A2B4RZ07_STYPI|nr:hypothetical protein AWC38_SpisGene13454 [Stylophora pistillata]